MKVPWLTFFLYIKTSVQNSFVHCPIVFFLCDLWPVTCTLALPVLCSMKIYEAVVDPQEGPPLFLDQSEAKRAAQKFLGDHPPRLI